MPLTVLNVAYPLAPVGPDAVGGAEQILSQVDAALVEAGHTSLVLASEGSRAAGRLLAVPRPTGELTDQVRRLVQERHRRAIRQALAEHPVDLVHLHGIDFLDYLPDPGVPALVTLHLPPSWYPPQAFSLVRPDTHLQCVSKSQRRACPAEAGLLPVIENGVSLDVLRPRRRKRGFAVALGRICPEKGLHEALDAARLADVPLLLGGEVFRYAAHERYFREEILPRLDARRRFLGPLGLNRKRRLLAAARCLLLPTAAPETSSLVAMEALACGTPVIAFPSGALPEIIEHGKTGFLVNDAREMAEAIHLAGSLDPADCRRAAETHFSAARMRRQYLELYERLVREHKPSGGRQGQAFRLAREEKPIAFAAPHGEAFEHAQPARDELTIEEVNTLAALESLEDAWRELWEQSPSATVFQTPEWLLAWRRNFPAGQLWTLAVWRGARLAGLAPLFVYNDARSVRKLLFLGTGNTDYLDLLAAPQDWRAVAAAALRRIAESRDRWDVCELLQLPPGSPLLDAEPPTSLAWQVDDGEVCPALDLPPGAAQLDPCVPQSQSRKWRYYVRRAGKTGDLRLERAADANFEELFDALLRLHQARWATRDLPGVLHDGAARTFHWQVATAMLQRGWLRLYGLRLEGRIIASLYAFCCRRRTYYYLGGFDPQFAALSPGAILVGRAIEQALAEGSQAFDFLRGREPYKYAWGATDHPTHALRFPSAEGGFDVGAFLPTAF